MKVGKPIDKIPSIDYIINDRNILDVNDEEIRGWLFKHKYLKWDEIDKLVIPDKISTFLGKLGRTIELKDYIFSLSKFYRKCVQDKKEFIREKYNEYLKGTDWRSCFWIIMFRHAIDSYHYYHIKTKGEKYKIMMDNYQELFDSFEKFFFLEFEEFNQYLSGEFTDFIDAVGKKGEIYQIRCVKHIGLKPVLQSSIINYLRTKKEEFEIKFINLLTGELITIPIKFDKKIMDYLKGN